MKSANNNSSAQTTGSAKKVYRVIALIFIVGIIVGVYLSKKIAGQENKKTSQKEFTSFYYNITFSVPDNFIVEEEASDTFPYIVIKDPEEQNPCEEPCEDEKACDIVDLGYKKQGYCAVPSPKIEIESLDRFTPQGGTTPTFQELKQELIETPPPDHRLVREFTTSNGYPVLVFENLPVTNRSFESYVYYINLNKSIFAVYDDIIDKETVEEIINSMQLVAG